MSEQYLYHQYITLDNFGYLEEVPEFITKNLSPNILLREYQLKAFQYFITHFEKQASKKQIHTLFHMATGSGKTVIMAGLLYYLYHKGYRRFLFFVNQTNILTKTKDNFLNSLSDKYLFTETPMLNGEIIPIREVKNFSAIDDKAINICFSSTQKLHFDINYPKEGMLTVENFIDDKIVLISDESHHINTKTKKSKQDIEDEKSWEYSVERIFSANRDNVLLEFTATCDLKDPSVKLKYLDKIIFDYPLAKFRESGYTKDFQNLQNNYEMWERTLLALLLSEYRRNLLADCKQQIKPVVLLKSQYIRESQAFYNQFFRSLSILTPGDLLNLRSNDNPFINSAFEYFIRKDNTLQSVVQSIKTSFAEENCLIMNGQTDLNDQKQRLVNSLEENDNPYRLIFTVDMLNEGWDVLNLFDIVRLYKTRQGSGKPGKIGAYTIKEAQLIGRGARYCPFIAEVEQERFKRKYDTDINHPYRILETMIYHSVDDSRYITELRNALIETGLLPPSMIEREYLLKEKFKQTSFFDNGLVFLNMRRKISRDDIWQIDSNINRTQYKTILPGGGSSLYGLFDNKSIRDSKRVYRTQMKICEVPLNILYAAMESFEGLKFSDLKIKYPHLKSIKEFVSSPQYIGEVVLEIEGYNEKLSGYDILRACKTALMSISNQIGKIEVEYEGTKEFIAKPLKNILRNKLVRFSTEHGDGAGTPQSTTTDEYQMNLIEEEWFVFEDHFGTNEEKAFVKRFKNYVPSLRKTYDEIYLVRNERYSDLAIFSFSEGRRFEPDFLLFLRKKGHDSFEQKQVFIEPKGNHLVENDAERWKEEFLALIEKNGVAQSNYIIDNRYHIVGMPFFNREYRLKEFDQAMERLTEV